mmetsp:Transcript_87177/g.208527  ORF Transcript_87177/g.208527 Transcript_87177/m.208527 type:complete len:101 (+) Transcript_87177:423-725(+)
MPHDMAKAGKMCICQTQGSLPQMQRAACAARQGQPKTSERSLPALKERRGSGKPQQELRIRLRALSHKDHDLGSQGHSVQDPPVLCFRLQDRSIMNWRCC